MVRWQVVPDTVPVGSGMTPSTPGLGCRVAISGFLALSVMDFLDLEQ
jgi:hypothetical protein